MRYKKRPSPEPVSEGPILLLLPNLNLKSPLLLLNPFRCPKTKMKTLVGLVVKLVR